MAVIRYKRNTFNSLRDINVPFKTRSISATAFPGSFKIAVAQEISDDMRT
jgi:hypothetical protein